MLTSKFSFLRGSILIILSLAIVLLNFSIYGLLTKANLVVKSQKEKELRFILKEYKNAIKRFIRNKNRPPLNFDEMLKASDGKKFLRRIYKDPFTNSYEWNFVYDANKTNLIIKSYSKEISLSGKRYCDW